MLTHGASVRTYREWSELVGLRAGDRYLVVYPFFHTAGLKSGVLACVLQGPRSYPLPVFDVPTCCDLVAERAHHRAPRPADGVPVDPRPPGPRDRSTCAASARRSPAPPSCRSRSSAACATSSRSGTSSPATASPRRPARSACAATTTRPRSLRTPSAARFPGVEVRVVDDDGADVAAGEPGEFARPRLQRDEGLLRRRRGHRRGDPRRRLAARPATSASSTTTATCTSPTARRTCSSSAGSTPTRPRSRAVLLEHPDVSPGRRRRRARRAHGRGRRGLRRPDRPAPRSTATRSSPGAASAWPTTRCPAGRTSWTSLPLTPSGKVMKFELRPLTLGATDRDD